MKAMGLLPRLRNIAFYLSPKVFLLSRDKRLLGPSRNVLVGRWERGFTWRRREEHRASLSFRLQHGRELVNAANELCWSEGYWSASPTCIKRVYPS